MVIEAVFEDLKLKQKVLAELEQKFLIIVYLLLIHQHYQFIK